MAKMRVLLAYSGGLDTSIIVPWLKENYDCDVVCVAGDVGQGEELEPLHEKAKKCGAEKLYIEDLRKEFVEDFIWPTLKAGAVYEGKYLLGTSFARPLIAKRLVEIAHKENCTAICHGCTGKGNDQVRFELTIKAFDPNMQIIAPWRIWDIKTREEEIDYAEKRGIPVPVKKDRPYSMDRNIWHISHEGADLEDPWNEPPEDLLLTSKKRFPVLDDAAGEKMQAAIEQARSALDSLGGKIECGVIGLPVGLGDPMLDGMENRIARLIFAIPAVKGVEFGAGFAVAEMRGSENNDPFYYDGDTVKTRTNHAGGILGGITNGMPLVFRAAVKPTPSIARVQDSVSLSQGVDTKLEIHGRHDPCIVPRAVPCVEAAAAIAVYDALLSQQAIQQKEK